MSTTIATHSIVEEIAIEAPAERIFHALTRLRQSLSGGGRTVSFRPPISKTTCEWEASG